MRIPFDYGTRREVTMAEQNPKAYAKATAAIGLRILVVVSAVVFPISLAIAIPFLILG